MPERNRASLTVERLSKLVPNETLWDTNVRGFCARRRTANAVTFYVKYRTAGRRIRWYKIGLWKSPWQPGTARAEAQKVLGEIAVGHDPQAGRESKRREATVTDVLTEYIEGTGRAKRLKPRTIAEYTRIRDDIVAPRIGRTKASELSQVEVRRLHEYDLAKWPYLANRVLALLRAAYNKSAHAPNPTRGIGRHHEEKRSRVLSLDELKRLSGAIRDPSIIRREGIYAIAAVRFLLLTGRRKEEALSLKWNQLSSDMTLMSVHDHKASRLRGTVHYALSESTIRLLATLPRIENSPYVFPSITKDGGHFVSIDETWARLCAAARIEGVRIHDLRRTHATHAADMGIALLSTSKMLGHSSVAVTESVYTQVDAQSLRPAANLVSSSLASILDGGAEGA